MYAIWRRVEGQEAVGGGGEGDDVVAEGGGPADLGKAVVLVEESSGERANQNLAAEAARASSPRLSMFLSTSGNRRGFFQDQERRSSMAETRILAGQIVKVRLGIDAKVALEDGKMMYSNRRMIDENPFKNDLAASKRMKEEFPQ
ncbi:histidine--tRNA ligase [Striga asiatica]|uniref:Histidine--tRNA ligase n=1 Tax=Striga asiatica TaxID=4170 RepID=A0A5A7PHR7_STRAF|nr:histidine--tRNA ligase [Striga asiatica]